MASFLAIVGGINIWIEVYSPAYGYPRSWIVVALRKFTAFHVIVFHIRPASLLLLATFRNPVFWSCYRNISGNPNFGLASILEYNHLPFEVDKCMQRCKPRWSHRGLADFCCNLHCSRHRYTRSNIGPSFLVAHLKRIWVF